INAQMARRILDRIVGYKISPILWKKVGSRLSAGRVQSVALRLIVERERAIQNFLPQEYWQIAVDLQKQGVSGILTAALEKINNEKFELKTEQETQSVAEQLRKEQFQITKITERQVKRNPLPPFITSTLQQEAFNKLGFNADRTMRIAQQLYEGIDTGDGEPVGLITYMRTDSVNISQEAIGRVREFIKKEYGAKYLPESANTYKSKKSAQEAHEAIRPSSVTRDPNSLKSVLDDEQYRLYQLIWNRFVACQMTPAIFQNKKLTIEASKFQFGVGGSVLIFDGYLKVHSYGDEEEAKTDLVPYEEGDHLKLVEVKPTQHFTKPPPRYSEASLVKALEEEGIGRPSTYAAIIYTLVVRNYVVRERGYFTATELGIKICDLLVEYFAKIMDIGFTAQMEGNLDEVEEGNLDHVKLLKEFYGPFEKDLEYAMQHIEKTEETVDKNCPSCGKQLVVKWGRRGKFLSCPGFPECKHAEPITSGVACPQEGCSGELIKRKSYRGRTFYGCSKYPECTYTSNELPEEKKTDSDTSNPS
ncbi:MAG: type I DNA topoisomerase, partial [Candidatus Omnitrophica bacterium]|nr:type I DNA topoisomerase [Candidatus Omnitrophota bacterium]